MASLVEQQTAIGSTTSDIIQTTTPVMAQYTSRSSVTAFVYHPQRKSEASSVVTTHALIALPAGNVLSSV